MEAYSSGNEVVKFRDGIPKYSLYEHERRWLLSPDVLPELENLAYREVRDQYINGSRLRLRKMTDSQTGEVIYKLTKKYAIGDQLSQPITTLYLSADEYKILTPLPHAVIEKKRYMLESSNAVFAVDVFTGRHKGLILAEIESASKEALLQIADPPFCIREVTGDEKYCGGFLSSMG